MPAKPSVPRVFFRDVAWPWPGGLAEARAQFAGPVAEFDVPPSRILTLKEVRPGEVIQPGPPRAADNVWLCYPGRRHAISATVSTAMIHPDDNPAFGIGEWVHMAVDPDEHPVAGPDPLPDLAPLVVDGVERATWHYGVAGLHCRAARLGAFYYAAICPAGEAGSTRLVTR